MDLLSLLLNSMTSNSSLNSLSQQTGVSQQNSQNIVSSALPMLMNALTNNASTQSGAQSLLGALSQHQDNSSISNQIANADAVDGAKIIEHIFGKNSQQAINQIAKETGTKAKDVQKILSYLAPSLLSSLNAATTTTAAQAKPQATKPQNTKPASSGVDLSDGLGLNDLMGLLSAGTQTQQKPQQSNNSLGALGSLAGALLGGGNQQTNNASNGTDLLTSLLTSMLK